jgi:hypothetical protein
MPATQQQLDDLLEHLIALTELPDPAARCDRLARLVLLLAQHIDDTKVVQNAIAEVMHSEGRELRLAIP